jgi:hypothetical protein
LYAHSSSFFVSPKRINDYTVKVGGVCYQRGLPLLVGIFWVPEVFIFSEALTKKKYPLFELFPTKSVQIGRSDGAKPLWAVSTVRGRPVLSTVHQDDYNFPGQLSV